MCNGPDRIKCAKGLRCLIPPMIPVKIGICVKRDGLGNIGLYIEQVTSSYIYITTLF